MNATPPRRWLFSVIFAGDMVIAAPLDNQRFARGVKLDRQRLNAVIVRRPKSWACS